MTLNLDDIIITKEWSEIRKTQKEKYQNIQHLEKFNKCLLDLKNDFDGEVKYFYNTNNKVTNTLYYAENTPVFYLFKLSPNGYFIDKDDPFNLWKKSEIDNDIIDKFRSLTTNKYKQPSKSMRMNHSYILFALQSIYETRFNTKIFYDCVKWAVKNEKDIVFKLHPFHSNDGSIQMAINNVKDYPKVQKYVKFVGQEYNFDDLLDGCEMLWTFSSGAGLQAILKEKPVSYFMKPFDYYPMCKYARTPEEAYDNKYDLDTVKKFLSWYYNKLTLDVTSSNFEDKLYERLDNYFNKKMTIHDLY